MGNEIKILKEGLFKNVDGKDVLLLGHCKDCGAAFFPERPFCARCTSDNVEQVTVSKGKLAYSTVGIHPSPELKMPLPYGVAKVDFPEYNVRITGLCTETDMSKIKQGQEVNVVVKKVYEEDGKDVVTYLFQPV